MISMMRIPTNQPDNVIWIDILPTCVTNTRRRKETKERQNQRHPAWTFWSIVVVVVP